MAMAIDSTTHHEFDFSGYNTSTTTINTTTTTTTSTTTSTDQDHYECNDWNDWSPVVDWEALSGPPDDFQDLIEYMIDDGEIGLLAHHPNQQSQEHEPCYSTSSAEDETNMLADELEDASGDTKGLRLVHLLMAAAEALNKSRELARVILVRLKELVSPNDGTTMERLASYFTDALQSLLESSTSPNSHHSKHLTTAGTHHHQKDHDPNHHHHHQNDVLAAFQLLQDMSPYVKFGHFTANQAVLEAVSQDRRIHIVDYDIMEGIQWASLMQAFVSRKDGPPAPHLRITALSRSGSNNNRKSIGTVQETGRRLTAFAASIGQPFSFHQCRLDSDESFRPSSLKLVRGEALVMNCMLHLPHFSYNRSYDSVASFLSGSKTLNPRLVTLVEEDTVGPTGAGEGGFVERFMDSLHHYSALCDSLEAGFPMQGRARAVVERVFLGPRIAGCLARMYRASARTTSLEEEVGCSWWKWLGAEGFRPGGISFANHCQAKLLLGLFNDGYRVEVLGGNRLVLGWKSRRMLSASVWTSPATSDSD